MIEHDIGNLKPAPNPREVLKFGDEEVQLIKYKHFGETTTIFRPRKNIPDGLAVCFMHTHVLHVLKHPFSHPRTHVLHVLNTRFATHTHVLHVLNPFC